jgi:acylphosphatase
VGGVTDVRLIATVAGRVQGVGFRYWVRQRAVALGLRGSATNLDDGQVRVVAEGSRADCEQLLAALEGGAGPGRVSRVTVRWADASGEPGFRVG